MFTYIKVVLLCERQKIRKDLANWMDVESALSVDTLFSVLNSVEDPFLSLDMTVS